MGSIKMVSATVTKANAEKLGKASKKPLFWKENKEVTTKTKK
jgi:hypothetical protein